MESGGVQYNYKKKMLSSRIFHAGSRTELTDVHIILNTPDMNIVDKDFHRLIVMYMCIHTHVYTTVEREQ